jgi:hypothetical protein
MYIIISCVLIPEMVDNGSGVLAGTMRNVVSPLRWGDALGEERGGEGFFSG